MQKLCKFIIGPANHRISSATTCPFNVFGSAWTEKTPPHMAHLLLREQLTDWQNGGRLPVLRQFFCVYRVQSI